MSYKNKKIAQVIVTQSTTETASTATTPAIDTSIPQNTEGTALAEYDTTITPTNASSTLLIEANVIVNTGAALWGFLMLFVDSTADALAVASAYYPTGNQSWSLIIKYKETAGTTLPRTYKLRLGKNSAGTLTTNIYAGVADSFGTSMISTMKITEILP